MTPINTLVEHKNIIGALMLREIITRYGRRGLGFLWLIGEPLLFTFGVMLIWSTIKAPYQHGLGVAPFVMTGYMSLIMFRHLVSYSMGALSANIGVLYHQKIKIIHLYLSRYALEFCGATLAFAVVYAVLYSNNMVDPPHNLGLIYWGWFSLFLFGCGVAMVVSALAMEFDVLERLVPVMMYAMLPFSGVFVMAAWVPEKYRALYMAFPLPHTIEMIRAGVFGEFIETHYDPLYPLFWGGVLIAFGLLLVARAKEHIDAE